MSKFSHSESGKKQFFDVGLYVSFFYFSWDINERTKMEFQEAIKLKKLCKEISVLFLFQQSMKTANGNLVTKLWYTTKSKTKKTPRKSS